MGPRKGNTLEKTASIGWAIRKILLLSGLSKSELAQLLGVSLVLADRWERDDVQPSGEESERIHKLLSTVEAGERPRVGGIVFQGGLFASRGASPKNNSGQLDIFQEKLRPTFSEEPLSPLIGRIKRGNFFGNGKMSLRELIESNECAKTVTEPAPYGASGGKNTYTYDAHTYHTKVPPQGIAHFLRHYLPNGGLVFDPFAGSGMTGVAARILGCDVVLNELSPAAGFIGYNFTNKIAANQFDAAVNSVLSELKELRKELYETKCRECGEMTETLYTVWSYRVFCPHCACEFTLWDHCRSYGKTVKEHKILSEFDCPSCDKKVKKSSLKRSTAIPVLLGYKCCSRIQVEHELSKKDLQKVKESEKRGLVARGFTPDKALPDGVNLNQPKRHGLDHVDKFYTGRNLTALSHIWKKIHQIEDKQLASAVAFVFTSLYQRVTRLSEFRFWGGSGNTANFNVPYIFNEANVFVTFERKSKSIRDHLETTAALYSGKAVVVCNSATNVSYLPDNSVDFIFTDPPFGANINYSEMNILWESWLGEFTDATNEAIVSRAQKKDIHAYQGLMTKSLEECYRVLRAGHWMLVVFMNSSSTVWEALKNAIYGAGFEIEQIDIFDKQHATFKQLVSDNAAGCDLVLHCRKPLKAKKTNTPTKAKDIDESIRDFLKHRKGGLPTNVYLHVERDADIDFRMLFSEWVAGRLLNDEEVADFASFRSICCKWLEKRGLAR